MGRKMTMPLMMEPGTHVEVQWEDEPEEYGVVVAVNAGRNTYSVATPTAVTQNGGEPWEIEPEWVKATPVGNVFDSNAVKTWMLGVQASGGSMYQQTRAARNTNARQNFSVGDKVRIVLPGRWSWDGCVGIIEKANPSKAAIRFNGEGNAYRSGQRARVPYSMLEKV